MTWQMIDKHMLAKDLRQRAEAIAQLQHYPNLTAVIKGCVSGQSTEWPTVRRELMTLIGEWRSAVENARLVNEAYSKLDEATREMRGEHFADNNGRAKAASAHVAQCCHTEEVHRLRNYKAATELALQQIYNMFEPPLVGTVGIKVAIVRLREALAEKVRVGGEG